MVARWAQAMIHHTAWTSDAAWAPGRKQLYVDDPTVVTWGSTARRATSFSLVVLLWLTVLISPSDWTWHLDIQPFYMGFLMPLDILQVHTVRLSDVKTRGHPFVE